MESLKIRWTHGSIREGLQFVDNKTICFKIGNNIYFLDLQSGVQSVFQGTGRGIGVLTASGTSGVFAFSEQTLSPSIFVYGFPDFQLKSELKGTAQLGYTSLALSDGGPYLGCCSSLPDHRITVWNCETAEPICTQAQVGKDVSSLLFNPANWLQLCTLGKTSITVWNIEKSASFHVLKPCVIQLPAMEGLSADKPSTIPPPVSERLSYFGPEMPPSAIAGLQCDTAEGIVAKLLAKNRLTPTAICWTTTSELLLGCAEGFLLLIDPESLSLSVLFNPTCPGAADLTRGSFQSLTLNKKGLIIAVIDTSMHSLQIKGSQVEVVQTWKLEGPATTVTYSPDYEILLSYSRTGAIYMMKSSQSDEIVKVLDVLGGNFMSAAFLYNKENICVTITDSGVLQLWSADGACLGSLHLQVQVTSLACSPVANYAAVGTASGEVLFVDLNEHEPRLVHQRQLYHTAVNHLVIDQEGHYLFTSSTDSHIYIIDAKPSEGFSVIGYTVAAGAIFSLSTQYARDSDQVMVLALCSEQELKTRGGSLLFLLSLPTDDITGSTYINQQGCLTSDSLKVCVYEVPHPLQRCVLGVGEVFAYCHIRKSLQRFQLPQEMDIPTEQKVQLEVKQEVEGHPLGPASLALSPDNLRLASIGQDGMLRVRKTASMEHYTELQCHVCRLGAERIVVFSADGTNLLTAGVQDGCVVCTELRNPDVVTEVKTLTQQNQQTNHFVTSVFAKENAILTEMPVWGRGSWADVAKAKSSSGADFADVTEQRERVNSLPSAPPSAPTWQESRLKTVMNEDNEKFFEVKANLRKTVEGLRAAIQEMMRENENLPAVERLPPQEFNLDVEEQRRVEATVQEEVNRVKKEIEGEITAKCYLRDILKKECWDSVKVKGRAIKGFCSKHEVKNYPLRQRTPKQVEELNRVQNIRKIEMAASTHCGLEKSLNTPSPKEEKEEDSSVDSVAVTGSFSAQLGCSNPYTYNQFNLQTTEQMHNQIILLQDVIHRVKTSFNAEFDAVHRQKLQELNRVKDRNRQIRDIMLKLDVKEEVWEPILSNSECPERLLTVEDSEIKAEKFLNPEQKKQEERRKLEQQQRLAAKADDSRERGLDDMMEGVLEVKKEDILKMEIPPPEFVLTKAEPDWSEEEKKVYKQYEKKNKALTEEKEKYKQLLETEMKKLLTCTREATERFDETLAKLYQKKFKCEMAVYQEELKITYLVYSLLVEEEMRNRELELKLKLEKLLAFKDEIGEEVKRREEEVELFHEEYDTIVAEDKILDKEFRKDFLDVPANIVDQLYKLFRRRPRLQKLRTQTNSKPDLSKERHSGGSSAADALGKMFKAMEELDAVENAPEGLNLSIWERFCSVRRTKIESEQKVKEKALTFAEMQAFLQKRRDEQKAVEQEIKTLSDDLERLHREKNQFLMDTMVQVVLKQGQVSTLRPDDYTDAVLLHRSVVSDLNRTIRTLAEQKITAMVECKDFSRGTVHLRWEKEVMRMQIEDLNNKIRDIRTLHLTEAQQDYLNKIDRDKRALKEISVLEKTLAFQEKTHVHNVQQHVKTIRQYNSQAAKKSNENTALEKELPKLQAALEETKHIYQTIVQSQENQGTTDERFREIVQKKNLEDLAKAQAEDLDLLWTELERLRMKNFPSLDELKHN